MHTDDRVAEWLVRWEEALAAGGAPPPPLEELPLDLREAAREGMRLLCAFARDPHALSSPVPADAPRQPPDTSRYRFEAFLAQGGMGEVWRGHDTVMGREVALKVMRRWSIGGELRARFEEEARNVGHLEHPAIVPVYDLGELPDGRPFFVMKLIHGQTLAALLAGRASPAEDLPRWCGVFEQVCQAVAYAHSQGVIHRDLKPSNVMLGAFGEVQVMDWGIAKALAAQPREEDAVTTEAAPVADETADVLGSRTRTGQARGTPAFMAPEQARGELGRIGKASDVFGLGGILCVILTGRPPFAAGNLAETFARLDAGGADAELIALAKACLAPEPEARPADAAAIVQLLKRYHDAVAERHRQQEQQSWLHQLTQPEALNEPAAAAAQSIWRQRAMAWLRGEVAKQVERLTAGRAEEVGDARQMLELLYGMPGLVRVRGSELETLPEPERQQWRQFWQELEALLHGGDHGSGGR